MEKKPAKRTVKRMNKEKSESLSSPQEIVEVQNHKSSKSKLRINKKALIGVMLAILVISSLYYFRGFFVAAVVNGQPVTRFSVVKELEAQQGKQILNSLVTKILVEQEAKKQKITVSKTNVDAELSKIQDSLKGQGQDLDQVLKLQGVTKSDLIKQIEFEKTVEMLLASKTAISDDELAKYLEDNKDSLPKDGDPEQLKTNIRNQLRQQKLSQEFQNLMTALKAKANISYFVNY